MVAIAAVDKNWAIGRNGTLLCHISADLKRFKALTLGHPVILGRKTLATFPGGRPLPGRQNMILSRDPSFQAEGAEVFSSVEALLAAAPPDSFVIGGQSVYRALLPYCQRAYITKIFHRFPADAWFPDLDNDPHWQLETQEAPLAEGPLSFQYIAYRRTAD